MSKIVIGKYALESLTAGMYSDPFVIYREYIQNSVDSIDTAYQSEHLTPGQEQVAINLYPFEKRIVIEDNGQGIRADEAEDALTGIGNSKKDITSKRGFRGIGRLAALSYCRQLIFETSFPGENIGSRLIIDASSLNESLSLRSEGTNTADEVMESVCSFEQFKTSAADHFFKVIMGGIDSNSDLLKPLMVKEYLEQVAPAPFDPAKFTWGKEIKRRISQLRYVVPEYNIKITCNSESFNIYKPYQDSFLVDKSKNLNDRIKDIEVHKIWGPEKELISIAWIAHTNYFGTINDRSIKGLRLRIGNIMIGDGQTLNSIFKDTRFNGWTIGEIYILDSKLLPNARRDNFEKTQSYFTFNEKMTNIAGLIVKEIRKASTQRQSCLKIALEKTDLVGEIVEEAIQNGITSQEKGVISNKLRTTHNEVARVNTHFESEEYFQEIAFDQLDMLIGRINGATTFKSINLTNSLTKAEKKILERVFTVLQSELDDAAVQKVTDAILTEFS